MKYKVYHTSLLSLMLLALFSLFTGCTDDESLNRRPSSALRTRFQVSLSDYDGSATRAAYEFVKGDRVYVLFHQGETRVAGTAQFDGNEWTVMPESSLTETANGICQLAFFLNDGGATSSAVALNQQTSVYATAAATYQFTEGFLTVHGQLQPVMGRIRFRGTAGQTATLDGLAFVNSFDLKSHTLTTAQAATCQMTVAADGFTPYYYAAFADAARQMTFAIDATTGLRRSFGSEVLQPATSGYITIPTAADHTGWTVVDLKTGEEVVVTTVGDVTVSGITSTEAKAECRITGGASKVNDTGFCWSTATAPTVNDSHVSCGMQTNLFSAQLTSLKESTTYYIRAYATTDRGVAYGPETSFITRPPMVGRALLAYYTFDDGTCDNVQENSYHGFLSGGSFITDTPNGEGKSLSLKKKDFVNISYNPLSGNTYTVSLWAKDFGTGTLFGMVRGTCGCPMLGMNASGYPVVNNPEFGDELAFSVALSSYQIGQWVHLAIVTKQDKVALYCNGRRIGVVSHFNYFSSNGSNMVIGGRAKDSSSSLFGQWADPMKVDNVRIHGAVLTDEEIQQIYDYER